MAEASRQVGVIVVAAGKGTRMGTKESKQYLLLQSKPILIHTLEKFQEQPMISEIVVVTGKSDLERCSQWVKSYGLDKVIDVIAGGSERQHSVFEGLQVLNTPWVMVHDGVRPFVTSEEIAACCEAAWYGGASVLAVPVKDTVKVVDEKLLVKSTPDRRSLWAIQTPQAFRRSVLLDAHEKARQDGFIGTDDSMLVERMGLPVKVVQGSYSNIKITTPEDLEYAEFLRMRRDPRGETNHD